MRTRLGIIAIEVLALAASISTAPAPVAAQQADVRGGFTLGAGLGVGNLGCSGEGCDDVTAATGLDVHAGILLSSRLSVLGEYWTMQHDEDRLTLTHTLMTVGAQAWLLPRLWLRAGMGLSRVRWDYSGTLFDVSDRSDTVPGVALGLGYELVHTRHLGVDLALRAGTGFYDDSNIKVDNFMIGLGANWY